MRPERREQRNGKIGIEMEILAQFGKAEVFGSNVGATKAKRRLAPIIDLERGIHFFVGNIPGIVVVDHFYLLEFPCFCFRVIYGARGEKICNDVVVLVLLQYLYLFENVVSWMEVLHNTCVREYL